MTRGFEGGGEGTSDGELVRLVYLRDAATMSQIDVRLRDRVLPALCGAPGVQDVYIGRRGPDQNGERIVASIWGSKQLVVEHMNDGSNEADRLELGDDLTARVEELPIAIALRFPSELPALVLRVFRGEVKEGQVDDYLQAARTGAEADASNGEGPLGLFLGFAGARRFVTVSVWPDWSTIQKRTGGNARQPIATRHAQMLETGTATHYEILPTAAPRARPQPNP
ncbi:MAG: hypothetical protein QOH61_1147 [Chloroflexota bacterium]|jgi:heme-degrading monooxygenase HmoA|nr:hypothetical protein [Chloroflexota bacterium]